MYLAHHELESVFMYTIVIIIAALLLAGPSGGCRLPHSQQ